MTAWANINIAFGGGWNPSEMDAMSLSELSQWHDIAQQCADQANQ